MGQRLGVVLAAPAFVAALVVAGGLADHEAGAADAPRGGTLRVSSPDEFIDSVDPARGYGNGSWLYAYATCAKLYNYPDRPGAEGARIVPEVAASLPRVSRDRRTYTFDLKRTFRFHTGAAVTARSFADAINRLAQPTLKSPAAIYLREIVGATAVLDGKEQRITGVRVLGRYGLEIRLTRPVGDLVARLTMPFFCPVLPGSPPTETSAPGGSGPYYFAERIVNQRTVLERNPYYRGNRPANLDRIVLTAGVARDECLSAVEDDRIDVCLAPMTATTVRRLTEKYGLNRPGGQFFVSPSPATAYIVFNHARRAFRGPGQIPLKKAINYAIDRPQLARVPGYLVAKRTDQLLPPALARGAKLYPLTGADPTTARQWLERAAWRPTKLILYAGNGPLQVAGAQELVKNLKQIGIDVEPRYFDGTVVDAALATPGEPFDLLYSAWATDYADGAGFFLPLLAAGALNRADPDLRRRIEAANRLTGEARRDAWADLDVALMRDDPPLAPTFHIQRRVLVSPSVGCVLHHPVYGFDLATACKTR